MREINEGFCGSMLIYLLLPEVDLSRIETILILLVGTMICTSGIWTVQEVKEYRKRKRFRRLIRRTTLWKRQG